MQYHERTMPGMRNMGPPYSQAQLPQGHWSFSKKVNAFVAMSSGVVGSASDATGWVYSQSKSIRIAYDVRAQDKSVCITALARWTYQFQSQEIPICNCLRPIPPLCLRLEKLPLLNSIIVTQPPPFAICRYWMGHRIHHERLGRVDIAPYAIRQSSLSFRESRKDFKRFGR